MAALENDRLVVRLAYAGAPMAGKTESVRALLPLLKGRGAEQKVLSPAEDRGRTAFFDWADYEGGAFDGKPIRCQITSAPGQIALSSRRELLLRGADAVILVVDSRSEAIERAQQCYEEMAPWLAEAGKDVPIRVLLQCNKQDLPGSLKPEELSRALGLPFGKDVYATSARTGKGLRQAFVAGVRVAVERAKALIQRGLILNAPEIDSGEELYELMQRDAAFQNLSRRREPASPRARADAKPSKVTRAVAPPAPEPSQALPSKDVSSHGEAEPARASQAPERSSPPGSRASHRPHAPSVPARASRSRPPLSARSSAAKARSSREPAGSTPTPEPVTPDSPPPRAEEPRRVPAARESERPRNDVLPGPSAAARARGVPAPDRTPAPAPHGAPVPPRKWSPAAGSRPAVMPASDYHALVGRPTPSAATASAPARTATPRASERKGGAPPASAASLASSAPSAQRKPGARPAVMPASAYLASLAISPPAASASAPAAGAASEAAGARVSLPASASFDASLALAAGAAPSLPAAARVPQPLSLMPKAAAAQSARLAVVPSDAWLAAHAAERASQALAEPRLKATGLEAAGLEAGALETAAPSVQRESPEVGELASSVPAPSRASARLAVVPSSAWLEKEAARKAAEAAARAAAPAGTPRSAAPARPSARSSVRPAVVPARAWRENPDAWLARVPSRPDPGTGKRPAVMPSRFWLDQFAAEVDRAGGAAPGASGVAVSNTFSNGASGNGVSNGGTSGSGTSGSGTSGSSTSGNGSGAHAAAVPVPELVAASAVAAPAASVPFEVFAREAGVEPPQRGSLGLGSFAPANEVETAAPATARSATPILARSPVSAESKNGLSARLEELASSPLSARLEELASSPLSARLEELASSPLSARLEELASSPLSASSAPPHASLSMQPDATLDDSWVVAPPELPGHDVAPRAVWPRTIWRTLEEQLTQHGRAIEDARGRWLGELAPGWYARTLESTSEPRTARRAFARAVLRHRRLKGFLSNPRCVALTQASDRFWVWQIVYRIPTLASSLGRALGTREAAAVVAEALLDCAAGYLDARERFGAAPEPLPLSLHALGTQRGSFVYAGLLPNAGATLVKPQADGAMAFEEALRKRWPEHAAGSVPDVFAVIAELQNKAAGRIPEPIVDVIRNVLIRR